MRATRAIFIKQALDLFKNRAVLIQFIIFPIIAMIFTELVAKADPTINDEMFVNIFAAIFAGMTLVSSLAVGIAEDKETKSLRFLMMAGVKPAEYFIGISGVYLLAALLVSVVFAVIGGFAGIAFGRFILVMFFSSLASLLLGTIVGLLVKNQQAATAIGMPLAMIFGFVPMITMFNEDIKKVFSIFYTQQLSNVINDLSLSIGKPILIIITNIVVLLLLFIIIYRKQGIKTN